ncbi:hypothetical protein A3759_03525 [Thalassolituus sp. HI0120]|nr:hypothetical protein A3759_03525 [Thalassolituus sp. HI0120]
MYIIEIVLFMFVCLGAFNLYGWVLAKSEFWKGLSDNYSCSSSEFRGLPKTSRMNGRFIFAIEGSWKSNDYIDVKITDDYFYLGVDFPLSYTVPTIKIPVVQCIREGTRTCYFQKRDVFSISCDDSVERKIAFLK